MQTFCDALEFETYNDPAGVEEPPEPPTPPPVMRPKPKRLALKPPPAKRTLTEKASERANRRMKTENPDEPADEPPAPEPDKATFEIGRNDMAALMRATLPKLNRKFVGDTCRDNVYASTRCMYV